MLAALGESALSADVPADIEGIDLGPLDPRRTERAASCWAAQAHGRRPLVVSDPLNGATQGNPRA